MLKNDVFPFRQIMFLIWFLLACFVLLAPAFEQTATSDEYQKIDVAQVRMAGQLYSQGDAAYAGGQFASCGELYAKAFDVGFQIPEVAYSAASCYARAGDKSNAFAWLREAASMGYTSASHAKGDSDLASLHDDARWQPFLYSLESNQHEYEQEESRLWDPPAIATVSKTLLTDQEKIAGLSKFWSEVKYNFAFPERLVDLDWDQLYMSYIPKVLAAKSTYDYYNVLQELCAKLKDSHTNVYPPFEMMGEVGLHTRSIEDKVMVIEVWDPELRQRGVVPRMELVAVDGQPVRQYGERNVAPYQSASTSQDLEARTFEYFLLNGPINTPVRVTLRATDGNTITRTLQRRDLRPLFPKKVGFEFKVLEGNIGYVLLNSFEDNAVADQFIAAFDKISKTEALILDVRDNWGGNSGIGFRILATLIDKPASLAYWQAREYRPIFRAWQRPIAMLSAPGGDLPPDKDHHYTKPVIVLTSSRSFSATEDFLVAFDASGRGKIVGEPSAGSTGQPLNFKMPGGGSGRVCTWRGIYPDGRAFLGIGVQPQKIVAATLRDFLAGKDMVLETAVAELRLRQGKQ